MNRIRDLRLQRGMNQAELAALLNCTTATVSKYELEQRSIDAPTILRLMDIPQPEEMTGKVLIG